MTGRFTARTRSVANPGLAACSVRNVCSSAPAPAISTNEAAICVSAKARNRRVVPPVTRGLLFDRLDAPSADGSRGANASSTPATSASETPTHNMLESTVRSSARAENRDA